jgi:redox-sensitive bicupin YhaK (pirin superfamily)
MTAGRGIVHSERTALDHRVDGEPIHGLQFWLGMPSVAEESDPRFAHLGSEELPVVEGEGKHVRLIAGALVGARSPLATTSDTIFADVSLEAGATMPLDADYEERGIYVVKGEIDIAGDTFAEGRLLVFRPGDRITVKAVTAARFAVIGGAPLDGKRFVWWNFVSSRKERIDQAREEWKQGRFGRVPGDEIEFIPAPENRPYTAG